jgi:ubiquinone biosynthesis protein Coq4
MRNGFDHAVTQVPRLVELAKQQTGATHQVVDPAKMTDDPHGRLTVDERPGLPEPVQRLTDLPELRQYPGRGSDRGRKQEDDLARSDSRDPLLNE